MYAESPGLGLPLTLNSPRSRRSGATGRRGHCPCRGGSAPWTGDSSS